MFSGGSCEGTALDCLHRDFKSLYTELSTIQRNPTPQIGCGDSAIRLAKNWGNQWDAYERVYKTKKGETLTVQIARHYSPVGIFTNNLFILKIFGDNGKELTHARSENYRPLIISQAQKAKGDDVLIKSALKAVTGRDFEVVVE